MTRVFQAWSGPDDLAETRRRCTRINYYLDWFCSLCFFVKQSLRRKWRILRMLTELTRCCIAFTLFPGLFNLYLCRSAFTRALVSSSKALDALDHARRTWSLHVSIWAMKRSQPKQRRFVRVIVGLILARSSIFSCLRNISDLNICPAHRYSLGIGWRKSQVPSRGPRDR